MGTYFGVYGFILNYGACKGTVAFGAFMLGTIVHDALNCLYFKDGKMADMNSPRGQMSSLTTARCRRVAPASALHSNQTVKK